jgi:potassium-dependent mechanosensitive channel
MGIGDLWHFLRDVWEYKLLVLDGQAIRVGAFVLAIALIVSGYVLSRRASRTLERVLMSRLHVEAGAAAAIETLAFYLFFAAAVVTGLRFVHFPLTPFTIVGGALAIGVGFGSQNVMNNFISGLILMLERPVRNGDLVEVEGTFGHIVNMGPRSTRVRASDNTDIIVPNSFFLENNVVNFTLSDDVLRSQVNVGVAYGSPTREVARIVRRVLDEHPAVLKSPEPRIIFADFGDNALLFEAYFWQRARAILDRRMIESEVRYRIDDLFREAGIVIAFPQRDLHVDSVRPIDVRVVGGSDSERAR